MLLSLIRKLKLEFPHTRKLISYVKENITSKIHCFITTAIKM